MQAIPRNRAKKYFLQEGNDDDGSHSSRSKDDLHQQLMLIASYAESLGT